MSVVTLTERARSASGEFEVAIGFEGGGEHLVTVADPLAGDIDGERLLAWYFEEHLRYPFLDHDREREAVDLLSDYGGKLFAQVFNASSDCSHEFRRARDAGLDGLRLCVVGGADFHRMHWESLRDRGVGAPLGARVPIVRRVENVAAGFDVPTQSQSLNVLVVTARPSGARDVGYRTISRPLFAALRRARIPVSVDLVRPGTWRALERHLQSVTSRMRSGWYGIVHFDVHGAVASGDALARARADGYLLTDDVPANGHSGDAFLFFETSEAGVADPIPTARVADLLVEHRIPVAVLNACQSAMPSGQSEASLAQRLVEAGVPVALGMAYSVTVTAAELMMPVVYEQLADGAELHSAIHTGRRRLFDERRRRAYFDQDLDLEDWVLPVVFSQRPVQLQPQPATPEQIEEMYKRQAWQVDEPEPTYGFVGRDLDIQAVERHLLGEDAHNELLIRGMAGAGKSTLLRHLGWWWQATGLVERVFSFSYEERAWTAGQIQQAIITELLDGQEQAITQSLPDDAQLERVAEMLRADRHLLVLDNAESITSSPASIPHSLPDNQQARLARFLSRLRGGKTLVLVGSREPETWLASSAFSSNVYQLGGLDQQAASVLVDRIITQHGSRLPDDEAERDALEELVGLLSGYPLALTVVLPAVASTPPSTVLAELKQGDEGADPEKLIQRAVEFSHGRLDPMTQNSLVVLAPFTGVIPTDALDAYGQLLAQHEPVRALGALDLHGALKEAIDVGLATPDTESKHHVRLQPLLPYFLRTRLADQADLADAVAHAHHDLYQQLGSALHALLISHESDKRAVGRVLTRAEYANLTTALDRALVGGNPVAPFIMPLEELLDQAHQQHARRQLLEQTIDAIGRPNPADRRADLAKLHNLAGIAALADPSIDDARKHHEAELALQEELGYPAGQATAHHQLGAVAQLQRRFDEAEAHYEKALEIYIELDDRHKTADIYHQLGMIADDQRRFDEAEAHYEKALEIHVEFNDRYSAASAYHQLGVVAQEQRRFDEAEAHYEKALEIFIEFDDRYRAAGTYHQLGRIAQEQRRFDEAEAHFKKALEIYIEFDDRYSAASAYHQLGVVAQLTRRLDEAEAHYQIALEIYIEFDDRYRAASTYHQLGGVAQEQRRFDEAEAHYEKALEIFVEFDDRYETADIYHQLGVVAQEQRRFDEAEAHFEKALEIYIEFDDRHSAASTYHQLGRVAQLTRRFDEAEAHYEKALEIFVESDDRYRAARAQSQLGVLLTQVGRPSEATRFSLHALLNQLDITREWSGFDLAWLKRQRTLMGPEEFRTEVVRRSDERIYDKLVSLLDQVDEPTEL